MMFKGTLIIVTFICVVSEARMEEEATGSKGFFFQEAPNSKGLASRAADILDTLSNSAKKESLAAWILGSDCWGQSLRSIEKDCRSMNEEEKTRLSIFMLNCLIKETQLGPVKCTKAMTTADCLSGLDSSKFGSFTLLFTNIHTICLSIQNRDFILDAERMTGQMAATTRSANTHLLKITQEMTGLSDQAAALHDSLFSSIETMSRESEARQVEIMNVWKRIEAKANALEIRQAGYEESLLRMLSSTDELSLTTDKIHSTLNQVVKYEERAEEAIGMILGRKALVSDCLFYLTLIACALLLGAIPSLQKAGPAVLLVTLITVMIERSIPAYSAFHHMVGVTTYQSIHVVRGTCLIISAILLLSTALSGSKKRPSLELETIRRLEMDLRVSLDFCRRLQSSNTTPVPDPLEPVPTMPFSLLENDGVPAAAVNNAKRRRVEESD